MKRMSETSVLWYRVMQSVSKWYTKQTKQNILIAILNYTRRKSISHYKSHNKNHSRSCSSNVLIDWQSKIGDTLHNFRVSRPNVYGIYLFLSFVYHGTVRQVCGKTAKSCSSVKSFLCTDRGNSYRCNISSSWCGSIKVAVREEQDFVRNRMCCESERRQRRHAYPVEKKGKRKSSPEAVLLFLVVGNVLSKSFKNW